MNKIPFEKMAAVAKELGIETEQNPTGDSPFVLQTKEGEKPLSAEEFVGLVIGDPNLSYTLANSGESYTGEEIRMWCEEHRNQEESPFQMEAQALYNAYWNPELSSAYPPNKRTYYFFNYSYNHRGFREARLHRDTEKSPK